MIDKNIVSAIFRAVIFVLIVALLAAIIGGEFYFALDKVISPLGKSVDSPSQLY